jgi:hypothetical protein
MRFHGLAIRQPRRRAVAPDHLKISKQVDRMTQLTIKLKIMNQPTADIGELLQERARRSEEMMF